MQHANQFILVGRAAPYREPGINKLTTGFAPVEFTSCPNPTITNERGAFSPGNSVVFTTYYRNQVQSETSTHTVYRPDGSLFVSWLKTAEIIRFPGGGRSTSFRQMRPKGYGRMK
ncbi:MAG: hypothetical protein M5U34_24205 [Chloroflexi bacterium]|nr:hypothetical protein [Chloroflexota bacterium]